MTVFLHLQALGLGANHILTFWLLLYSIVFAITAFAIVFMFTQMLATLSNVITIALLLLY